MTIFSYQVRASSFDQTLNYIITVKHIQRKYSFMCMWLILPFFLNWFRQWYILQKKMFWTAWCNTCSFFKNEADDALKKDKTIFTNHFAAKPLNSRSVSYIRETWYGSWTLVFVTDGVILVIWEITNPDLKV